MTIENTLTERGNRYGTFLDHATIAQGIQEVYRKGRNWDTLDYDIRQALVVISDKIARILNGDPFYSDNFHDIAGYAKLVDDRLKKIEAEAAKMEPLIKTEGTTTLEDWRAGADVTKITGGFLRKTDKIYIVGETPNHAEIATTKIKDLINSKSGS